MTFTFRHNADEWVGDDLKFGHLLLYISLIPANSPIELPDIYTNGI